jgi:murein DD-endopeptidase MepM/ murein hydrolase activator NlpD
MARRLLLLPLALALLLAAPASADLGSRKQSVDSKIAQLHDRIAAARQREASLSAEIASVTTKIRSLEAQVGDVSSKLAVLEDDLALHRRRLDKITALFDLETKQLHFLQRQYAEAVQRLNYRIVQIYETDEPSTIDVLLAARSIADVLDQLDYLNSIAHQDKRIAHEVGVAKAEVRQTRERTQKTRASVASETQVIAVRTEQQAEVRNRLLASQGALSGARAKKQQALAATKESERSFVGEADALSRVSAQISARIQAAQSSSSAVPAPVAADGTPSAHGLVWPASGPVTSPFGYRWGRLHAGIDIGAGYGAPIVAAAAGRVIYCGWMEGYGNLTVIDHGGGLATAYGHQSSISVACGQDVAQGQTIGAVGSTGHSTGPHLHFEVRVNGTPVDPLGYL